jgi:hypothetical protein
MNLVLFNFTTDRKAGDRVAEQSKHFIIIGTNQKRSE